MVVSGGLWVVGGGGMGVGVPRVGRRAAAGRQRWAATRSADVSEKAE